MRSILLWFLGVPIPIIILIALFTKPDRQFIGLLPGQQFVLADLLKVAMQSRVTERRKIFLVGYRNKRIIVRIIDATDVGIEVRII